MLRLNISLSATDGKSSSMFLAVSINSCQRSARCVNCHRKAARRLAKSAILSHESKHTAHARFQLALGRHPMTRTPIEKLRVGAVRSEHGGHRAQTCSSRPRAVHDGASSGRRTLSCIVTSCSASSKLSPRISCTRLQV
jgi:hypothetical protein